MARKSAVSPVTTAAAPAPSTGHTGAAAPYQPPYQAPTTRPAQGTVPVSAEVQAPPPATVAPAPVSSARETSVSRLVVPLFKAHLSNRALEETWLRRRTEIQAAIIDYLNAHSFIEAIPSKREYGLNTPREVITSETQADGGDGVLVGEFQGTSLEISVKTAFSGRDLTSVSIPVMDLDRQSARAVAEPAADAIAASFRYSGYVLAVRGNEAKINIGKNQNVVVGARYDIFNFAGESPTLSSPIQKIGEMTITQIRGNSALGRFSTYAHWPVLPYAKVSPAPAIPESAEESIKNVYRVSQRFYSYLGAAFMAINTQVSPNASFSVQERLYQLPLSPALQLGLGYSGFNLEALAGQASNSSNNVTFIQGSASQQVYRTGSGRASTITSAGLYYSNYSVSQLPNPTSFLISTSSIAPEFEERFQWTKNPVTRLYGAIRLYYPVISNDSANGQSAVAQSLGGGLELGWRHDLGNHGGLDLGAQTHYFLVQTPGGSSIDELEYSFFTRLLLLF